MKLSIYICVIFLFTLTFLNSKKIKKTGKSRFSKIFDRLQLFADMAHLSDASYDLKHLKAEKWELVKEVKVPKINAFGMIVLNTNFKMIVVAIRGTVPTSWKNIWTDLKAVKSSYPLCTKCEVHSGFNNQESLMFNEIQQSLNELILKNPKISDIIITGHSLGGAVATLVANHLKVTDKTLKEKNLILVTFGSPRVGNPEFAAWTNTNIGVDNIYRVVYHFDPVTTVPLMLMGYQHIGNKRYVFNQNDKFEVKTDADSDVFNPWMYTYVGDHSKYKTIKHARFYRRTIRRYIRRYY